MKTFYVTTPIYYPNDIPHIGHAYTTLAADILARWHKLIGDEVFFLTGTDDHGKKIEKAALQNNKTPKEFTDLLVPKFKEAWAKLNIKYTGFIRTTDIEHKETVQLILQKVHQKGDIYRGSYTGDYCTGCEGYYTEKDLIDGCCPIHKTKIEKLKEETYFFKLSKYQNELLELYEKNNNFIMPDSRKNEIINRVKEGISDLSISRTNSKWGINLPFDEKHITYVWFDALTNYISGVSYPDDAFKKFWPADVHLVGKDILWFHSVIWPAMLMSAGIQLPKTVFAHGWWTFNKEKISKSRGKVVNVDDLISIAGLDPARYFLFREIPFGHDGDFTTEGVRRRRDTDLANELGNLVSRTLTMVEKYCNSRIPYCSGYGDEENILKNFGIKLFDEVNIMINNIELMDALVRIWEYVKLLNQYIEKMSPWNLNKDKNHEKLNTVIYTLCSAIRIVAVLISPFIPDTSNKIIKQLGLDSDSFFKEPYEKLKIWEYLKEGITIKKEGVLFPKG
ncbi:MAG: methionine--tRNA ligase [Candidatus Firestonebacteria bacterium]